MNRVLTALALSGMFVAAPAFARTVHKSKPTVAKSVAGDKAGETKPAETKPAEGTATDAKPAKTKKSKKKAGGETPAPAPTEGAPSK